MRILSRWPEYSQTNGVQIDERELDAFEESGCACRFGQ